MVSPLPPDHAGEAGRESNIRWFAGLAMQAIIARQGIPETPSGRDEIALWSFRMAEAMVAVDHQLHATEDS